MADTHGPLEPHPQPDTSDHGHHDEAMSDEPIARPDGSMPPAGQRTLSLGVGIAGTVILLLIVAGVILYMNRNGNTAEAPPAANASGGAAPEAILTNASAKEVGVAGTLAQGNAAIGQSLPGTFRQQSAAVKPKLAERAQTKNISLKAATPAARTSTPGAGGKATATPTKAAPTTNYQDPDGRFGARLPSGWTADDSQKNDWFVVEFVGTDPQGGPWVDVYSEDAGDATLDDLIALDQKAEANSEKYTYKDGPVTDTTVAGEPAKTYTFTYVLKTKPNAQPWTGQSWEVIHNGTRWKLGASAIGTHKTEIAAVISSFAFTDSGTNGSGETTTFTDPNGLVTLTYPSGWTTAQLDNDDANVLYVKSPAGNTFALDILDQTGTPDQELKTVRDNRASATGFAFKFGNTVDLKIGGEPAKMLPWVWTSKQNTKTTGAGRDYVVNHNGKWFGFSALASDTNAFSDVDTILTTVSFGGSGTTTTGNANVWQDPSGTMQVQVPNGWTAGVDSTDDANLVTLQSPNGEVFFIDVLDPFDSLDTVVGNIKANHQKSDKYTYKDGEVKTLKVGGEDARSLAYTYQQKGKSGATAYQAKTWVLNHNGQGIYMSGSPLDQAGPTVEAIISSIKFLK